MASDFLKVLREIRGTGAPEAAYTDGIYYDLTIALTGDSNAPGKYGHMVEMYNNLTGPAGSYTDFVAKYNDFLTEYADVLVKADIADQAAVDAVAAKVAVELLKTDVEGLVVDATAASSNVTTRLDTVQLNGSTVEDNLNTVGSNALDIGTVAGISSDVTAVSQNGTKVSTVADSIGKVTVVSDDISNVNAVADSIDNVDSVSQHLNAIDITASMQDEVNRLAISPAYPAILSAKDNAFKSEREAWEAEAQRYTADSYANEAPHVFVKLWSSVGDGTFTYINSSEYSARHYSAATNGLHKLAGFFDASTATGIPLEGDPGGYLEVSVAGDVNGSVNPPLAVYDELRWNTDIGQYDIYRKTIPFANLLDVPENVSNAQSRSEKGQPDGYAPLNSNTLIPAEYLPSYVDDVIEVATYADLPLEGETGKIYVVVADETNGNDTSVYRWTGTTYAMVSNTLTAADIKALYESNLDTNVFTDAEKIKLADTEVTAQLDLRDTANRDRVNHTGTQPIDTVTETASLKILTIEERNKVDVSTVLDTTAQTLPTAVNEVHGEVDSVVAGTTNITYDSTISGLTATSVKAAIDEVDSDLDLHRSNNGSEHSFIDQDVTTAGTPRFNSVQLNGGTGAQGLVTWNDDENTLNVVTNGTTLQVGQELLVNVRNATASLIPNGTPVMYSGTLGASGRLLTVPMDGTVQGNAINFIGLATEDIDSGTDGKVTMFGKVRGVDTTGTPYGEVWAEGDVLYTSPLTPGYLTNVSPSTGQLNMAVAVVVAAHTNGTLYIRALPVDKNDISPAIVANFYNKTEVTALLAAQDEASELGLTPVGNLTSTTIQAGMEELQGGIDSLAVLKAPLAGPVLTGVPEAPTAAIGTATTQIATTAFVNAEIANDTYSKTQLDDVNVLRADKYLAAQNIANMIYTDGNLTKIQYNNATDVDYEVFGYGSGNLTTIQHYTGGVLRGTTTLSYTSGNLVSAIFVGV